MPEPQPDASLNPERDRLVADLRALVTRYRDLEPGELELKGILGRGPALLEAQLPHLDAFQAIDLDSVDPEGLERVYEAFSRLAHLPNMILALGAVLDQDEKSRALDPLALEAVALLERAERLLQRWALRQV